MLREASSRARLLVKPNERRLGGGVDRLAGVAHLADHRGEVHDRALALLHHRPRDRLATGENAPLTLTANCRVEVLVLEPQQQAVDGDARRCSPARRAGPRRSTMLLDRLGAGRARRRRRSGASFDSAAGVRDQLAVSAAAASLPA